MTRRDDRRLFRTSGVSGALWACALVSSAVWTGCSIEKNYATLSFFFDGVPDPAAKAQALAAGGVTEDMRKSPTYSLHKPFAEEKCWECHKGQPASSGMDAGICMNCHKAVPTEHARMHGPVVAGACLWCHAPHESAQANLLKKPARQVCAQCHEQQLLDSKRVPEHADENKSCLECHSGHGGRAAMFLKEGLSRLAPAGAGEPPKKP